MASSVMMAGVPPAQAYRVAERVEQALNERGVRQIASRELRDLAASLLAESDESLASSYLRWQAVEELDQPLIILVGGATGVGKSTVATQLAARLGITRVISTDAIREVLRAAVSQELIPALTSPRSMPTRRCGPPSPRRRTGWSSGSRSRSMRSRSASRR
jgi:2-phosphoglycerate kinase